MSAIFTDNAITKLLFDLDSISKIQRGQVISTTSEYINVEDIGLSVSVFRTVNGDSREKALIRIRNNVQIIYEYAERLLESRFLYVFSAGSPVADDDLREYNIRFDWLIRITSALRRSTDGLKNLSATYKKDYATVGQLQEIIKDIAKKYKCIESEMEKLNVIRANYSLVPAKTSYVISADKQKIL